MRVEGLHTCMLPLKGQILGLIEMINQKDLSKYFSGIRISARASRASGHFLALVLRAPWPYTHSSACGLHTELTVAQQGS